MIYYLLVRTFAPAQKKMIEGGGSVIQNENDEKKPKTSFDKVLRSFVIH